MSLEKQEAGFRPRPSSYVSNQDIGGFEPMVGWREPGSVVGTPGNKQGQCFDGYSIKQCCSMVTSNFMTGSFHETGLSALLWFYGTQGLK